MPDLLWLLLPVAAASGWIAARRASTPQTSAPKEPGSDYFRGLNFLLDNRPDEAIEVFTRMVEVNPETVETHLALGSLFRRRGEVDRAIHIHQNLVERPSLSSSQRSRGLLELGEDYMKAGVFDRAESLFRELAKVPGYTGHALCHLLIIYQQEKDWQAAIDCAQRLDQVSGESHRQEIAQFWCELAEESRQRGATDRARQCVDAALKADAQCVRASLVRAELESQAGNHRTALEQLWRIEHQDAALLPVALPAMRACYDALGERDALIEYLDGVIRRQPCGHLTAALAELRETREGSQAAEDFLVDALRRAPSVAGLRQLVDLKLRQGGGDARAHLETLFEVSKPLLDTSLRYRCSRCGFEGRSLHWRCPGCQAWNAMRPRDDAACVTPRRSNGSRSIQGTTCR